MFRSLGHVSLIVALLAASGTHWGLLQSVAWTTMLADNLRTDSFVEAVHKTFDGQHPCCLCKAIAAGKKSEQKKEFTAQMQKLEFPPLNKDFVLIAPSQFQLVPQANAFAEALAQKPPTPPPRGFFV